MLAVLSAEHQGHVSLRSAMQQINSQVSVIHNDVFP